MADETATLIYVTKWYYVWPSKCSWQSKFMSFIDPAITLFCMNKCYGADSANLEGSQNPYMRQVFSVGFSVLKTQRNIGKQHTHKKKPKSLQTPRLFLTCRFSPNTELLLTPDASLISVFLILCNHSNKNWSQSDKLWLLGLIFL